MVSDLGEKAASKSPGLVDLGKCCEHHSERDMDVVTRRYKLQLPVRISELKRSPGVRYMGSFNVISLRSWCEFLTSFNCWHVMVGLHQPDPPREQAILAKFWKNYRQVAPDHQLWQLVEKHSVDLSRCCPVMLHADEGRGRKRAPFWVASYHSFLGYGTTSANEARQGRPYRLLRLNYNGSSNIHRMVTGVLPKMLKDEAALDDLLSFITADSYSMLTEGVLSKHGDRFWMVTLNATGDWAWLRKVANLSRSYHNVPKRPLTQSSKQGGICHWCLAGQKDYPFEDLSCRPAWLATMFQPGDMPWTSRPRMLDLPHQPSKPMGFFAFDLWHSLHLGLGKCFCASALALLSDQMLSGNIDARFEELTTVFLQWADETHTSPYMCTITKEICGWPMRTQYPNGMWSKGHVTTCFMLFLEDWLTKNDLRGHYMLQLCSEAVVALNRCLKELYSSDLWLPCEVSHNIGRNGMLFLQNYMKLAKCAYDAKLVLWPYMPKSHICHHVFLSCLSAKTISINAMAYAVQVDEDFIGKKCRASRRVAPGQVILRTLQRSLNVAYAYFRDMGFLKG